MTGPAEAELRMLAVLEGAARGPKREGAYAVWLVLRVALDLLEDAPPVERAHRRRVQALEQRLTSLTMPPPVRRALASALQVLRDGSSDSASRALTELVAPVREGLGQEAAAALQEALKPTADRVAATPRQH